MRYSPLLNWQTKRKNEVLMCGIAGIHSWFHLTKDPLPLVQEMVYSLRHRGPDQYGAYVDDYIAFGQSRLSIIDIYGGSVPISNEDGQLWLVCNGQIFNYVELRQRLRHMGHRFVTRGNIEVLLHLYEEYGPAMLNMLNGQFALAIWDRRQHQLFLARDHVGICPLFYKANSFFAFASEIKALFCLPEQHKVLDDTTLAQTCLFGSPLPGRTSFTEIRELKPGCFLRVQDGYLHEEYYWQLELPQAAVDRISEPEVATEAMRKLMHESVRLRLRADVPVGIHLNGALESSVITAMTCRSHGSSLRTFSLACDDEQDDARCQLVARHFRTEHTLVTCSSAEVGENLRQVIWHTEKPLLRGTPLLRYLLAQRIKQSGCKVLLSADGADEFFGGLSIYKETKIRLFIASQPSSAKRKLLLQRLYPHLEPQTIDKAASLHSLLSWDSEAADDPFYSHRLHWQSGAFILQFFSPDILQHLSHYDPIDELAYHLNGMMDSLDPMLRSILIEYYISMGGDLLSSQGDRIMMGLGIEPRYPFLDKRVIYFGNHLTPQLRLRVLNEKWIVKQAFAKLLPLQAAAGRIAPPSTLVRKMYTACQEEFSSYLEPERLRSYGWFEPKKIEKLLVRFNKPENPVSAREEMALMLILSVQILHELAAEPASKSMAKPQHEWLIYDKRSENSTNNRYNFWHSFHA